MPTIGATANCASCGAQIVFKDPYWDHTGENKPRHIAQPSERAPADFTLYDDRWRANRTIAEAMGLSWAAIDEECSRYTPGARWEPGSEMYVLPIYYAAPQHTLRQLQENDDDTWAEYLMPDYVQLLDSAARELSYTDEVRLVSTSALDALRAAVAAVQAEQGRSGV